MNVYFYTVAKAASDYVAFRVMQPLLGEALGLKHFDFADEAFQSGTALTDVVAANRQEFDAGGRYFGALRQGPLPDHHYARDDKIVIHVRDPRDCLTSLYFSVAYSHAVPEGAGREQFLKNRERVVSQSIDKFCLSRAPRYAGFFEAYAEMIEQMPGILISRYEDMVSDFETWLQRLLDYLDVPATHPVVRRIIRDADFEVGDEDIERHKRRVMPGDFLEKLAPETIA